MGNKNLTKEDVVNFFKENPYFFQEYPEVLKEVLRAISGEEDGSDGKVVDLSWRIIQRLQNENRNLRESLEKIIQSLKMNESIQKQFNEIEKIIFYCHSTEEMIQKLVEELEARFGLDFVCLSLVDDKDMFPRNWQDLNGRGFLLKKDFIENSFCPDKKPIIRNNLKRGSRPFFPEALSRKIKSELIVPLIFGETILGSLNIGSFHPNRYSPDDSTELLEQLADKIAIALNNVRIQEKLKTIMDKFLPHAQKEIVWEDIQGKVKER